MNIVLAAVVIVASASLAIAAMLAVRKRAPEGSYFSDGDRAAGMFGVIATGFSVLIEFLVFLGSRATTPRAPVHPSRTM